MKIVQSKLLQSQTHLMKTMLQTDGMVPATKTQADLGLAKFSDENFETVDGFVRVKDGGIKVAELPNITTGTVLGRTTAGTGTVEEVPFADAISAGSGVVDADFTNT